MLKEQQNNFLGGPILVDDEEEMANEEVEVEESDEDSILDLTAKERKNAKEKLDSGTMLFPEEEEEALDIVGKGKKRTRTSGEASRKNLIEIPQETLDEYYDLLALFDPATSSKKSFRAMRKMLAMLCNIRYPRKPKVKKAKK